VFSLLSELSAPKQPTRRLSSIDFSPDTMDERSGKRLNAVVEHITSHQHRPISVEEMASVCNLSPPAFCRWFKQIFKCSFVAYMTERRIENACRLLETSDMSVSRIGDQVGFESYSNFNRAFTKIKNIPPREYRRATL
jgi:transcriptional regulator GlxA family with amidase domain